MGTVHEVHVLLGAVDGPRVIVDTSDEDGTISPRSPGPLLRDHRLWREQSGFRKRALLFTMGFVIGVLLFLIGGISWQPTPPKCPGCAVLEIQNSQSAVQRGRPGGLDLRRSPGSIADTNRGGPGPMASELKSFDGTTPLIPKCPTFPVYGGTPLSWRAMAEPLPRLIIHYPDGVLADGVCWVSLRSRNSSPN